MTDTHIRQACHCAECEQAQVTDMPQLRDPHSWQWLHGYDLKRAWEASDAFRAEMRAKFQDIVKRKRL